MRVKRTGANEAPFFLSAKLGAKLGANTKKADFIDWVKPAFLLCLRVMRVYFTDNAHLAISVVCYPLLKMYQNMRIWCILSYLTINAGCPVWGKMPVKLGA